jgi:hypothetical protein
MLGTEPRRGDARPAYNLAAATTDMMWACALATTRTAVASTARGLALWTEMLRAPIVGPPFWRFPLVPLLSGPHASAEAGQHGASAPDAANAAAAPGEAPAFASYRSSGGHAAAQVTVSDGTASH